MVVIDARAEEIKQSIRKGGKAMIPVGIIIALLIVVISSLGTVGAGERGVMLQFGAVQDRVIGEGLYFKIPFVQTVEVIDVRIQKDEVLSTASSKDLQIVTSKIALNYHLDPDNVNNVWQEVGKSYNTRIIAPSIQEAVKSVTARFTAEELITKREEVKDQIKANLFERLSTNYIIVDEFNIIDFSFSAAFNEAIEAKVTAEQLKLKADRDLERIRIEADQNAVAAEGKAKAILTEAQALRANPQVVELRWIEKWDGKTPLYWGEASPFIGLNQ
ncbi:prohibitin family protein [Candidatus Uhrbacteria bacterium]|jgi:regulator of protease activity HflC (stomatin/prohibitin superfamily)|nr:prohibitin family protein [Candidatus Uhrbacteria bacterium]